MKEFLSILGPVISEIMENTETQILVSIVVVPSWQGPVNINLFPDPKQWSVKGG